MRGYFLHYTSERLTLGSELIPFRLFAMKFAVLNLEGHFFPTCPLMQSCNLPQQLHVSRASGFTEMQTVCRLSGW